MPLNPQQFADFLIRWRAWLLLFAVLLGAVGWWKSRDLDYDRSVESMFSEDDPVLIPYLKLKETFGGNEIALAVYEDPNLMSGDGSGIKRLESVALQLAEVDGVQEVLSLAEVNRALKKIYDQFKAFIRAAEYPIVNPDDTLAVDFVDMFEGYTHSADHKIVSIVCMLDPNSDTSRDRTIDTLRSIIQQQTNGQLTGEPAMIVDGFRYVQADGKRLAWSSTLLLAVVIIACFRSIRWVMIPLIVMQLSIWSAQGLLVMAGLELTMVSSMMQAIVTVISVATVVHIIVWYRAARGENRNHRESVRHALEMLAAPIAWACLTDAFGFAALLVADVGPVRDFGLMMTLASLLVLLNVMAVVPALAIAGESISNRKQTWNRMQLNMILGLTARTVQARPKRIALVILFGVVFLSLGFQWARVETDFTKNFRKSTNIAQSYQFVEEKMGGAGVIDVVVPAPKRIGRKYINQIIDLEEKLRAIRFETGSLAGQKALNKAISLADADRAIRKQLAFRFVPSERLFQEMAEVMPTFTSAMRSTVPDENGQHYFRIMLRTTQQLEAEQTHWLITEIQSVVDSEFPPERASQSGQTTGFFVLLSQLVNSVLADQFLTFGIAACCIFISMTIAFRSFMLGLIALIPNLLPILVVMGALGWLGVKINMGAAMIAAVSVGLSIDSSIHYLWSFRRQLRDTANVSLAIERAQQRVGRAATFSTLALVAGFLTLVISEFVPTIYFGLLVSVTMIGGLLGNLVMLPLMLKIYYGHGQSSSRGEILKA